MKLILLLTIALVAFPLFSQEIDYSPRVTMVEPTEPVFATRKSLLDQEEPPRNQREMILRKTILYNVDGSRKFHVQVWAPPGVQWPGNNAQIIEIKKIDPRREENLYVTTVGRSPILKDAWGAIHQSEGHKTLYLYLKCAHRHGGPDGIYTYRIEPNGVLSNEGVVYLKEDIEVSNIVEQERWVRIRKRFKERKQSDKPVQPSPP